MSERPPAAQLAEERRRLGTLARVLPLAAIEPDGLAITSEGTYVRVIECEHVLQPWRGDLDHRLRLRERLKQLITRIPDRQALQVIVEAEPLEPRRALTQDWLEIRAAMAGRRHAGADPAAIEAMENFGYGLEQTVRRSAAAVSSVTMRWWVVVPYRHRPSGVELPRFRRGDALTLRLREHEHAAYESSRLAANILSDLRGLECRARELDGSEYLALLSRWFHPGEEPWPAELFKRLPRLMADTDPERARRHRGALLAAITRGAAIDLADPEHIVYPNAGQVESIAHVTTPPDTTSLYWLLNLMCAPPPWRLSVHIHARDRAKTRRHYRLRWRRIWAGLQRKQREAKLISPEEFEQEREAGEIDAELRLSASGVYDVSIFHSQRAPAEQAELLDDERQAIAREMEGATDARLYGGRFLGERSFVSCLPLGTNPLGASRGFASRNIADCVPLLSTSASSRGGVPIGYAIPGNTLERVDLFDPAYRTHVALITGASGGGKTVFVNTTLMRSIARGAQGMIVDRSSSEDAETGIREAGHYEALVDLVPGAEKLHFGADRHDAVLCPWDVPDPARVGSEKVRFLVALHTLLIGDPGRDSDERELSGEDRSLLERGIERVYTVCAETGERPRESLLRRELLGLARHEEDAENPDGDPQIASKFRGLAARLHSFCQGGAHAWLADEETTIPAEAPLLLCDLAGLHADLAGPVMLTLVDHMGRAMQQRRSRFRHGAHEDAGPWAGKAFLVIDESWAQLRSKAAGSWLNEWARRTRHMSCALYAVTQQLEDFDNEQGHALVSQSVLRVYFRTSRLSLNYIRESSGLDDSDLETITRELQTQKGDFSEAYIDSEAHGRARVRIYLSDMEYWAVSSDPERDQPVRQLALEQAGGDPWSALRLLVDPAWHREQARAIQSAAYANTNGNGAGPGISDAGGGEPIDGG